MTKLQAVGLQRRTVNIMSKFFGDIKILDQNDLSTYQMMLSDRVKNFFYAMNNVGVKEFASFLKKHQFENTDAGQQQKYTDAFNCLVAFIVAEYSESDLLRYFLAKNSSPEAKPTSDSHSWRIVYWAQLLGYWARKLFNTQRYEMVATEPNQSLGSAIKALKQDFSKKDANYFDLHQTSAFNENLEIVVGKFVENPNANVENAESIASSNNVSQPASPDASFINHGFEFKTSSGSSMVAATLMSNASTSAPTPTPPPPASPNVTEKLITSSDTHKPTVSNVGNDRDNLLKAIKRGIKLKSVNEGEKLLNNSNINSSNDLMSALKDVLSKRRDVIQEDREKTLEDNGEDWVDGLGISVNLFQFNALSEEEVANLIAKLRESLPQDFNEIKLTNVMSNIKSALEAIGVEVFTEQPIAIASEIPPQKTNWQLFKGFFAPEKDSHLQQSNKNAPKPAC